MYGNDHSEINADLIAEAALKGTLMEVACTPKPGLVDRYDQGANNDMDIGLFMLSSSVLGTGFVHFAKAGLTHEGPFADLLRKIRVRGIDLEKRMFSATGNVNTQKGSIFLMGLICAVAGTVMKDGLKPLPKDICDRVAVMTEGIVERELSESLSNKKTADMTKGELLFLRYGIRGIRGEVEDGLPTVLYTGLPSLYRSLSRGYSINDAGVDCLLNIMTVAEDSNVISRSSPHFHKNVVREMARQAILLGGIGTVEGRGYISYMNEFFKEKNVNPGGCADLLAVTLSLHYLSAQIDQV